MQLMTKYEYTISTEIINTNINRLTNQLWKIIPMRENKEDWQKQLETVTLEIAGLGKILCLTPQFLQLISKLEGLLEFETEFELYRKTVFESINLLQGLKNE